VIKRKDKNTLVSAHWALWKAILYLWSLRRPWRWKRSTGNGCPKPCINTFSYYRWTFKRCALLS